MIACSQCSALLQPGARFCPKCGAAVPQVGMGTMRVTATLVITDGAPGRSLALLARQMTLGRAADNDIVVDSPFVSRYHAQIEPDGLGHRISDKGSRNGLLFNGVKIPVHQPHPLSDGDTIRIGDVSTGNFVTLVYHNSAGRSLQGSQPNQSYPLDPHRTSIGRIGCTVTFNNPLVSRLHATIERTAQGGHIIVDYSSNGTFVNGKRVAGKVVLQRNDSIQIGPFTLVYYADRLDTYDQRGGLRIDGRKLHRVVSVNGQSRAILQNVSLSVQPREFVALVGGSGAGKSTLLNALAGYARASSGEVLVNGDNYYRNFDAYRSLVGYVPQDDIVHRTLRVDSALRYAAKLRLPPDMTEREIADRIDAVLDAVEMTAHKEKLVEQLSGGQRKRVSIAVELLADPRLFFLDEPTSGLDPGLEKKMMYMLRRLADAGRTIFLVTHATANIRQCDLVAFMGVGGRLVYFGPPQDAQGYFGVTSGDFADIYSRIEGPVNPQDPWIQHDLLQEYTSWQAQHQRSTEPLTNAELWQTHFETPSQYYTRYVANRLAHPQSGPAMHASGIQSVVATKKASSLQQFVILTRRYAEITVQDRRNLLILLLQAPIIGALLMVVSDHEALVGGKITISIFDAQKVLLMLATVAVWFGVINAAREITKEAAIYRRERLANLRILPYVMSKVCILSLLVLVQSAILLGMLWIKVAFPSGSLLYPVPIEFFITTLFTSLAGLSLGLLISAFSSTPDRAISIVPLALIPQILFAGVIFPIEEGFTPTGVLSWFTISHWAMDAYGATANLNALPHQRIESGYTHSVEHLLSRWALLLIYMVCCIILTIYRLRQRDKEI